MRRVCRRLLAICSAVSLAVSVAVCMLWVRSYQVHDVWGFYTGDAEPVREYSFNSCRGRGGGVDHRRLPPRPRLVPSAPPARGPSIGRGMAGPARTRFCSRSSRISRQPPVVLTFSPSL
jgi:hypothetical protein